MTRLAGQEEEDAHVIAGFSRPMYLWGIFRFSRNPRKILKLQEVAAVVGGPGVADVRS